MVWKVHSSSESTSWNCREAPEAHNSNHLNHTALDQISFFLFYCSNKMSLGSLPKIHFLQASPCLRLYHQKLTSLTEMQGTEGGENREGRMDTKCLALIGRIMSCPLHCQVEMVRRKLDDLSLKFRTQPEEKTRLLVFNSLLLRCGRCPHIHRLHK